MPSRDRKSGMPHETETPAPVRMRMRWEQRRSWMTWDRELMDLMG